MDGTEFVRQGLHIWPTEACLLSELCDELVTHRRDELERVIVVLPTQRQVTSLLAMLAVRLKAFRPPILLTLDPFVSEWAEATACEPRQAASDLMQELVLAAIIRERGYRHLQLGHEHELKQFFNDISEYGMGAEACERLAAVLHKDVFRAQGHLQTLTDRVEEIAELYHSFLALLADHQVTSPMVVMSEKARHLASVWQGEAVAPGAWLYLACFTTLRAYYKPLFRVLLQKPNVSLWLSQAPELMSAVNPLGLLAQELSSESQVPVVVHQNGPRNAGKPAAALCRVHQRGSVLDEVAHAFKLAADYAAGGCPPSQIAILLTNENRYGKIARSFAKRLGVGANLAIATPLAQTALGVWLGSLMEWFGHDEKGIDLLAFMVHPVTMAWLKQHLPPAELPSRERLSLALNRALAKKASYTRLEEHCEEGPCRSALLAVKQGVAPLFRLVEAGSGRVPLRQWTRTLEGVFASFGLWGQTSGQDTGVAQSSVTAIEELLHALLEASLLRDPLLSKNEFWKLLKDKMLSLETRSIGYPLKGVQVLNLIESRYVPFQVVIILGCLEGAFPKALPKDYLIDDWLKEQIGLPGWQYVEALEDTTFQLLKARVAHLHLSYPSDERGATPVRSRFVEKLLVSGQAQLAAPAGCDGMLLAQVFRRSEADSAEDLQWRGERWRACRFTDRGQLPGQRWGLLREVTATSLQRLIQCPYRFLLAQLGVSRVSVQADNQRQEEGAWLHAMIQAFFTGYARGRQWLPALPERIAVEQWPVLARERLADLTRKMAALSLAQAPLYYHLAHFAWPRFIEHMPAFFEASADGLHYERRLRSAHEWGLGLSGGGQEVHVKLTLAGGEQVRVAVKGVVDRLDRGAGVFILTDYKRQNVPTQAEVASGVAPQLALYAVALSEAAEPSERLDLAEGVIGYWSILDGTWQVRAAGPQARAWGQSRGLLRDKASDLGAVVAAALDLWSWRLGALLEGEPFAPDRSKACTYCEYQGLCRQGDPHQAGRSRGRQPLAERLRQRQAKPSCGGQGRGQEGAEQGDD